MGRVSSACFSLKESLRLLLADSGCAGWTRPVVAFLVRRRRGVRGRRPGAGQHVGIAAGVFGPLTVAFGRDDAGDDAVEEVAVVADEDDRAGVVGQKLLQEVEGFEVEIVGGSSRTRTFDGLASARASMRRRRVRRRTRLLSGERTCSEVKRKSFM